MQGNVLLGGSEQLGHFQLGQPHRLAVRAQLDAAGAVLGGVEDQVSHASLGICVEHEVVLFAESAHDLIENIQVVFNNDVRLVLVDLLVRQGIYDVSHTIRLADTDLIQHIAELPNAKERRHILQDLPKHSEVICPDI